MTAPVIIPAPTHTVTGEATAVTTAADLFEGRAAAGEAFQALYIRISNDLNTDEVVGLRIAQWGTVGTGGTALAEEPEHPDFAASVIEWVAEPTGAPSVQTDYDFTEEWNLKLMNPFELTIPTGIIVPTNSLLIELLDAPSASTNFRLFCKYAELPA